MLLAAAGQIPHQTPNRTITELQFGIHQQIA